MSVTTVGSIGVATVAGSAGRPLPVGPGPVNTAGALELPAASRSTIWIWSPAPQAIIAEKLPSAATTAVAVLPVPASVSSTVAPASALPGPALTVLVPAAGVVTVTFCGSTAAGGIVSTVNVVAAGCETLPAESLTVAVKAMGPSGSGVPGVHVAPAAP